MCDWDGTCDNPDTHIFIGKTFKSLICKGCLDNICIVCPDKSCTGDKCVEVV
jgi:hypothetical protein